MRTLLALALALGMFTVSGCGGCGDDVCYAPAPRPIASSYCGPVEPLAPLPTSAVAPVIGPAPVFGSGDIMPAVIPPTPAQAPYIPSSSPNFCPPGQYCGA